MRLLDENATIPPDYECPISRELMEDPVILSDGHSYERVYIESWLENKNTSPFTNKRLSSKEVISNHTLRKSIESFVESANARYLKQKEKPSNSQSSSSRPRSRLSDAEYAAKSQLDEAMGLGVESSLRISDLEYENGQLSDWNGIGENQREKLKHELSQQETHTLYLLRKSDERKLTPERKDELEGELTFCNQKLAVFPSEAKLITKKACVLRELGRYAEAIDFLNDALKKMPRNVYLLNTRGYLFRKMGKLDAALADFDKLLTLDSASVYAIDGQASIYNALEDKEKEGACIAKLAQLNPNHWRVKKWGSHANHAHQDRQASTVYADTARQDASSSCEEAKRLKEEGRYEESLVAIDRAIRMEPTNSYYLGNRANTLVKLNRYSEAAEQFDGALSIDPNNFYALVGGSMANERTGKLDRSKELCERALSIKPNDQHMRNLQSRLEQKNLESVTHKYRDGNRFFSSPKGNGSSWEDIGASRRQTQYR